MKWRDWLEEWKMTSLRINVKFLQMEWSPSDADRDAAWDMYVELLTRVTTQPLAETQGDEKTALESVFQLFPLTREIIRKHKGCLEFTKIGVVVLNQVIRPFTAKWHKLSKCNAFDDPTQCRQFRVELETLQEQLGRFTQMLGTMADVEEDLTSLEGVQE